MGKILGDGSPGIETTWVSLRDVVAFAPLATLAEQNLFDTTTTRLPIHRNNTFAVIANQKNVIIYAIRVSHDFTFTVTATEPQGSKLHYFEQSSGFDFKVLEKNYDRLAITLFMGYQRTWDGASWGVLRKEEDIFTLPEPLRFPPGGNVEMKFVPASTTLALITTTASITPLTYDLSFTSNRGYTMWVNLLGKQDRQAA